MPSSQSFRLLLLTALSSVACGLLSCDPTYPISISNKTADTISIFAETNVRFHTDDTLLSYTEVGGPYDHKVITFKIAPGIEVRCGMAIAELDNDVPFSKMKIYTKKDSIIANSVEEVLGIFDRTWYGSRKKPYTVTLE
jgi:hypothetical protein